LRRTGNVEKWRVKVSNLWIVILSVSPKIDILDLALAVAAEAMASAFFRHFSLSYLYFQE